MPLVFDFVATQNTSNPTILSLTEKDVSGSDTAIVSRRVSFKKYDGTFILNGNSNYWNWPLADVTVDFSILLKDLALYILVELLDAGGNTLYMADKYQEFDLNNKENLYDVLCRPLGEPTILQDANFQSGVIKAFNYIFGAKYAMEIGGNLTLSQGSLDGAANMFKNTDNNF